MRALRRRGRHSLARLGSSVRAPSAAWPRRARRRGVASRESRDPPRKIFGCSVAALMGDEGSRRGPAARAHRGCRARGVAGERRSRLPRLPAEVGVVGHERDALNPAAAAALWVLALLSARDASAVLRHEQLPPPHDRLHLRAPLHAPCRESRRVLRARPALARARAARANLSLVVVFPVNVSLRRQCPTHSARGVLRVRHTQSMSDTRRARRGVCRTLPAEGR